MKKITEYAITTADRYWPFPNPIYPNQIDNRSIWTMTVHEATCRYAKYNRDGKPEQGYFGENGLRTLAAYGFAAPTNRHQNTTWKGCKVCGTASLGDDYWKSIGQATLDAKAEAERARNRAYDEKAAQQAAERAAKEAIFNADHKATQRLIANHQAEFDALVAAALAGHAID